MTDTHHRYGVDLAAIAPKLPRLASVLQKAQLYRAATTAALKDDARFKGANSLLHHLDQIAELFKQEPTLNPLAFLIRRSCADFEAATEATLSGYIAVAFDAMRDVLEIQYLLMDFATTPAHINEWLAADERTLKRKFSPVTVRQRLKTAGVGNLGENGASADYRGHSMALHVRPGSSLIPVKGHQNLQPMHQDIGFWEIFEHSRGLWSAISMVVHALAPGSECEILAQEDPPEVVEAWEVTNRSKVLFLAIINAEAKRRAGDLEAAALALIGPLVGMGIIEKGLIEKGGDSSAFYDSTLKLAKERGGDAGRALRALIFILGNQPVPPPLIGVPLPVQGEDPGDTETISEKPYGGE